jgi:ferritin-like protein
MQKLIGFILKTKTSEFLAFYYYITIFYNNNNNIKLL